MSCDSNEDKYVMSNVTTVTLRCDYPLFLFSLPSRLRLSRGSALILPLSTRSLHQTDMANHRLEQRRAHHRVARALPDIGILDARFVPTAIFGPTTVATTVAQVERPKATAVATTKDDFWSFLFPDPDTTLASK